MSMRDLVNNIHSTQVLDPQVATDATVLVTDTMDTQGFSSLAFIVVLGTLAATAVTGTVEVYHGDESDMSDEAAVEDKDLNGTEALAGFTQADDGVTRKIGYVGSKRYVRVKITPTSNDANLPISVVAIQGHAHETPTDNPPQ